jgi:hypothetical protein
MISPAMPQPTRPKPASRARRRVPRAGLIVAIVVALYSAIVLNPWVLFHHEVRAQNVVFHARDPFPAEARAIAEAARERVARSPFFDPADEYHVYLCDTPSLFAFFAFWNHGVGAVAQVGVTGNIYMRPSHVARDRLLGPSGNEVPGERTLTYFVAHEITHTMVARRVGRLAYFGLETWQQEGYADYVGKGGQFDFDAALADFRSGAKELDPAVSGLYLRYHLLTQHLLEHEGVSAEALLASPRDPAPIERELRGESR